MKKLFMIICITIFSWLGWWVGAKAGLMTAYIFSVFGGMAGVYVALRIKRDYMQ
jgi:hypothetical protein